MFWTISFDELTTHLAFLVCALCWSVELDDFYIINIFVVHSFSGIIYLSGSFFFKQARVISTIILSAKTKQLPSRGSTRNTMKLSQGSTEIWTRIAGFKVRSANHYTIRPHFSNGTQAYHNIFEHLEVFEPQKSCQTKYIRRYNS